MVFPVGDNVGTLFWVQGAFSNVAEVSPLGEKSQFHLWMENSNKIGGDQQKNQWSSLSVMTWVLISRPGCIL